VVQPYSWKGREYIGGGVNVYHNRARIYDPAMGRFTSEDPMGYAAGTTNLYTFGWNNPRRWNDPSGLAAASEDAAAGGMVLASAPAMIAIACKISQTFNVVSMVLGGYTNIQAPAMSCTATGTRPVAKPIPIPYRETMKFPGNCRPDEAAALEKQKNGFCDAARSCKPGRRMSKPDIANAIEMWDGCAAMRRRIMERCYMGGNTKHEGPAKVAEEHAKNCRSQL
jgi:RHS repeat-associated protein